jgi:hypothetical protein
MIDDDDDKSTVVLDYAKIKEQLNQDEKLDNDEADTGNELEIEFAKAEKITIDENFDQTIVINLEDNSKQIICFGYKTDYFTRNDKMFGNLENLNYISDLQELNTLITKDENSIVILYYNSNPKAVNQVSMQIRNKFPTTKSLIIVKKLSPSKAQAHAKTKYGADAYLSDSFTFDELLKTVKNVSEQ